jgi:multidrug efflux pump subunit AcrB
MKLFNFFLKNRYFTLFLLFTIFILGFISYTNMPQRLDPKMTPRVVTIKIRNPGMSAKKMMLYIGEKLNKTLDSIDKIKKPYVRCYNSICTSRVDIEADIFKPEPVVNKIKKQIIL